MGKKPGIRPGCPDCGVRGVGVDEMSRAVAISAGVLVLGSWVACGLVFPRYFGGLENSGQLGDTFGAVNALFSGLALVGVLYAVALQREELEIAKREARENDSARLVAERAFDRQVAAMLTTAKLNAAGSIIQASEAISRLDRSALPLGTSPSLSEIASYKHYLTIKLRELEGLPPVDDGGLFRYDPSSGESPT